MGDKTPIPIPNSQPPIDPAYHYLFSNKLSLTRIARDLSVTPQSLANWLDGTHPFPPHQKQRFDDYIRPYVEALARALNQKNTVAKCNEKISPLYAWHDKQNNPSKDPAESTLISL